MSVSIYEPHVACGLQGRSVPIPDSPVTQTVGYLAIPTAGRMIPTATVSDAISVVTPQGRAPARSIVQFEQWLDLWISRRYAGGALPVTLDATQAINRNIVTLRGPSIPLSSPASASTVDRMIQALRVWTGMSTSALASMLGLRSTKTLYNWRDRPTTAPRPKTYTRLLRVHALVRAVVLSMGLLDGRTWLAAGDPSPLDLLARGDIAAVERLARDAGVHTGTAQRTLSPDEANTLRHGGLRLDPPTPALRDGVATRATALADRLLRTGHTVDATARILGVSPEDVRRRIHERKLYAVPRDGEWIIPAFQFEGARLIRGIEQVVPYLPEDAHIIEVYTWFTSPSTDLEDDDNRPRSARDWLLAGGAIDPVITLAADL